MNRTVEGTVSISLCEYENYKKQFEFYRDRYNKAVGELDYLEKCLYKNSRFDIKQIMKMTKEEIAIELDKIIKIGAECFDLGKAKFGIIADIKKEKENGIMYVEVTSGEVDKNFRVDLADLLILGVDKNE